jgi:5'-3' exonuclease
MDYIKKERHIPEFDLAIIDADSLMYLIAWTTINQKQGEKGLDQYIDRIITETDVSEALVFIKGDDNFRYKIDPEYKANRKSSMDPEVLDRVELLYSYARKHYIQAHGGEADDLCSIYSYQALEEGKLPVVCHIDKDLNMIPGWHYNFKKKEFYYISPEESFTFMCRQLLSGDMSADNIPGLKGVGDATAAKLLHNRRLSQMKDEIIHEWSLPGRAINGDDDKSIYNTPEKRYKRFLDSANCLILRETEEEMRPLTEAEILRKMEWREPNTDYLFHKDRDVSDMILLNSLPINCFMETKRPARCKKTPDTGEQSSSEDSTPTTTSDSSTE